MYDNPNIKRKDDKFMRRVIWLLLATSVTSASGWIWTLASVQSTLNETVRRVEKLEENQNLLVEIRGIVRRTSVDVITLTNEQKELSKILHTRTKTIENADAHMKNRRLHK